MTDERFDIEIQDKVSPAVSTKLKQIAEAAREADSSINELKASLAAIDTSSFDKLAAASAKVTSAQAKQVAAQAQLNNSNARLQAASDKTALSQQRLATATAQTETATQQAAAAASRAQTAAIAQQRAAAALAVQQQKVAAATSAATAAQNLNNQIRNQGNRSLRQAQYETRNLVYQLNDIVVGLVSGQKPLTVFTQQGSQISTIYGPGLGVRGTLQALGNSLKTVFAPLLPAIALLAAAAATVGILTKEIRDSTGVAVSFGDTFKAIFQVAGKAIADAFSSSSGGKIITQFLKDTLTNVVAGFKAIYNAIVGTFVTAYTVIRDTFSLLPAALKDIFAAVVNTVLNAVEFMVNGVISGINGIIRIANEASQKVNGKDLFSGLSNVDLSQFKQTVGSAATDVGKIVAKDVAAGFSKDYAGNAYKAIAAQAVKNFKERQDDKTGAHKLTFADIVQKKKDEIAEVGLEGQAREVLTAILDAQERLHRKLTAAEVDELTVLAKALDVAKIRSKLLDDQNKGLTEYNNTVSAGTQLLKDNLITLEQYKAALAKTQLATDVRAVDKSLPQFQDKAAIDELQTQQQDRIAVIQQGVRARILTEQEGADRIKAINAQLAVDIGNIEAARNSLILTGASDTFSSLADAAKGFAGEQSGIYKALFVTSKAFAIADSIIKIQQGIANAFALPFPANLAAAASTAAAAASIVSTIQSIQFAAGKKDGGFIAGPGGPRDDKVPIMASNGEFVVNAAATARNRSLLEAINDNRPPVYRANGGIVGVPRNAQSPSSGSIGGKQVQPPVRPTVNVNIYAQDAQSVIASRSQVSASMARAVNAGYRNL